MPARGVFGGNESVGWLVTRSLESHLTTWPIQGWRPPGADTAIRPLRVDGWPAPTATLVLTSRTVEVFSRCFRFSFPKGKIVPPKRAWTGPGFLSLVQGSSRKRNREPRPGKIGSCQPVVLAGRVGSNPTPGAILKIRASQIISSPLPDVSSCSHLRAALL